MSSTVLSSMITKRPINSSRLQILRNISNICFERPLFVRQSHRLISSRNYRTLEKRNGNQILTPKCYRHDILRNESTNQLKTKTALKSANQLKLAQVMNKCPIEAFPLIKGKDFNENRFQKELKPLLKGLKICEQNQLNNVLYYPSVSTILGSTLSVQSLVALDKWKKLKISQLGEQGFMSYQKNILSRGKLLHQNIKNFIQTKDESTLVINESIEKLWKSLSPTLDLFGDVKLCETPVSHPFLCYKGIVDCVAFYSGKLVIIEWKTSEKMKPTLKDIYDNPLQAVAYLGAINYETNHYLTTDEVVLVYAYEDGSKAQIHELSAEQCLKYWNQWLARLKTYWDLTAFRHNL